MWAWGVSLLLVCLFAASVLRVRSAVRTEQAALRLMRLCARELRAVGTSLHGLAGARAEPGLAIAAAQVLATADSLQTHAPGAPLVLREETVDLAVAIADAVTAASASLSAGKRVWRTPSRAICLWADSRALRHILGHVLADAIRATREQDWIEISITETADGPAIVVQDEGEGLIMPDQSTPTPRDSRGIGLRLALARRLMQAHGGRLAVEAHPGIGSRVSLVFPAARVRTQTPVHAGHAKSRI